MKTIALIGANGMLATAIRKLAPSEYQINVYDLPDFDLTDRMLVMSLCKKTYDVIINCAAYTNVDGCEEQRDLAMQVNGQGPGLLAELALASGAVLVHLSTDFVFDGKKNLPYLEGDQAWPLSIYGKSKLSGEQQIQKSGLREFFIIRTSWLYGSGGKNFVDSMIRLAKVRAELKVVADQRGTPTWTEDLARAIFVLLQGDKYGIYHYSNEGDCSWYELACEVIDQARTAETLRVERVLPIPTEDYPLPAVRPKYSVLSKEKISQVAGIEIPVWQQSLKDYLTTRQH